MWILRNLSIFIKVIQTVHVSNSLINTYLERPPLPQQEQRQYHHQPHNSHPGHYSAPSSPPLLNQKYSPYARKQSIPTHHLLDQESPLLKTVMRRNSSAVMYRETDHSTSSTRRMSMVYFPFFLVIYV